MEERVQQNQPYRILQCLVVTEVENEVVVDRVPAQGDMCRIQYTVMEGASTQAAPDGGSVCRSH